MDNVCGGDVVAPIVIYCYIKVEGPWLVHIHKVQRVSQAHDGGHRCNTYVLVRILYNKPFITITLSERVQYFLFETPFPFYISHNFQRKGNGFDILSQ